MRNERIRLGALAMVAGSLLLTTAALAGLFSISVSQEKDLGARAASQIESKSRLETGARANRVASIGHDLARATGNRDYQFSYKVISDSQVNAFALPGGYVYIYSGMLDRLSDDDQIAAVLAHETIHVTNRHFAKQYRKNTQRQLGLAVLLGLTRAGNTARTVAGLADFAISNDYSRQDETDADIGGMNLMHRAGYDVHGMVEMLQVLQRLSGSQPRLLSWTSDHPQINKRIRAAERHEAELKRQ